MQVLFEPADESRALIWLMLRGSVTLLTRSIPVHKGRRWRNRTGQRCREQLWGNAKSSRQCSDIPRRNVQQPHHATILLDLTKQLRVYAALAANLLMREVRLPT